MVSGVLHDGRVTGGRIIHPRAAPFSLVVECYTNTGIVEVPVWSPRDMTGATASLWLGATQTTSLNPVVSGADDNIVTLSLSVAQVASASGSSWEIKTASGLGVLGGVWEWSGPGETQPATTNMITSGNRVIVRSSSDSVQVLAAESVMPAADILAELLTVDGAGSGLDADLLDGQHASNFATAAALTAESTARAAADTALDGRVDALEAEAAVLDLSGVNGRIRVVDGTSGGVNVTAGATVNVNTGTTANTIAGGGTAADPNTILAGIVNVIGGGYDNTIDATGVGANTIAGGAHHRHTGTGSHGAIGGGSYNDIVNADYSTIAGGTLHEVNASYGGILGGSGNTVSEQFGAVVGGASCVASSTYAIAGGLNATASGGPFSLALGRDVTASGVASVALGRDNQAVGNNSVALGQGARAASVGSIALASGSFAAAGDAQATWQVMRELTTDGTVQTMDLAFQPQVSSSFAYRIMVTAREPATGESKAWEMRGLARRNATTTVTLVGGAPTPTVIAQDAGAAAWTVTVLAGTGTFNVRVTGEATHTIRWVALVELVEVVGA